MASSHLRAASGDSLAPCAVLTTDAARTSLLSASLAPWRVMADDGDLDRLVLALDTFDGACAGYARALCAGELDATIRPAS